jgi:cysteine desulfurase
MNVYLDHNSTTPLAPEALEAMQPYLTGSFGNASSPYALGRQAREALESSREALAVMLGASSAHCVCFTGSGSEADNMAIQGAARAHRDRGKHIITSAIEHSAVLNSCRHLEEEGFPVTYVKPDRNGMVRQEAVAGAIRSDTILISVMHANNETGTVNPVAEIGSIARSRGILFHVDAVQSFCKIPFSVKELNVDLLSISGHKVQGPKGVGALYIREGVSVSPLIFGGHQEEGRRAGTENIAGIVGFVKAAALEQSRQEEEMKRIRSLRDRLEQGLLQKIPDARLNGHPDLRLPNTLNLSFPFVEAESLLLELDLRGVAVSSGSACMSGTGEPSHVLLAIGMPPELCRGSLRFSLGSENTEEEIRYVLEILPGIVQRIRAMSPLAS